MTEKMCLAFTLPHMSLWTPCGLLDSSGLLRTPCRLLINWHKIPGVDKDSLWTPCSLLCKIYCQTQLWKELKDSKKISKIPKNHVITSAQELQGQMLPNSRYLQSTVFEHQSFEPDLIVWLPEWCWNTGCLMVWWSDSVWNTGCLLSDCLTASGSVWY